MQNMELPFEAARVSCSRTLRIFSGCRGLNHQPHSVLSICLLATDANDFATPLKQADEYLANSRRDIVWEVQPQRMCFVTVFYHFHSAFRVLLRVTVISRPSRATPVSSSQ